jgi:hypothetical protein
VPPSPDGRRGATSYRLMGPGPPVQDPLLNINVEPWGSHNGRKQNVIFLLDSGAHFSVLPFSPGPWSNDKVIILAKSGQPLEC